MTSLELIKDIEGWLSFNQWPSGRELKELKLFLKNHIKRETTPVYYYIVVYTERTGEDAICCLCDTPEEAERFIKAEERSAIYSPDLKTIKVRLSK